MATTRLSVRRSRKSARSKTSESLSSEPSPDSKCPICLDVFHNMSYLDLCLHKFCFRCIHEWSKNKAECPLCKQPFNSIYHSIKSEKDFKKYDLRAAENGSFGSFGSFGGGARFRYRTTLTGVRRQQAQRRTSPPPDNGVMFESLSVANPLQLQERTLRHMMARLAARRKAASEGREVRQLREEEMVTFRRELYRRGVRVRSVRDGGRSRDTSAEFYQRNPACLHRLIPWLKRELMVLYGAHGSLVNIVQHIIMSRITRHDMEDGAIQDELSPFLQGRTEHFLHEFISFAKSPFNMEAYDQHAAYDLPAPSSNDVTSSNSSVIAISEDEQDSPVELDPPGDSIYSSGGALSESAWDDETPGPSYSTMVCLDSSRSQPLSIRDSDSDSSTEEEGGQGETMQECRAPTKQESPHHPIYSSPLGKGLKNGGLSSDDDDDDSDCVIVGFVKPVRERTPELVRLSSNSSEEESPSHQTTEEVPMLPQHIRFVSVSPPDSQCGEQRSRRSDSTEQEHNQIGSRGRCSNPTVIRHKLSNEPSERRSSRPSERRSRDRHSRDRHDRNGRGTRYSRSRERQRTRSRDRRRASKSRDLSRSRGRRHSPSRSRDRLSHSKRDSRDRKMDGDHNCGTLNTERRSYYSKCHSRSSNRRSYSRSRSRSQGQESSSRDKHSRHPRSGSQSPSAKRKSRHDKPGGKRKYKTRHLEEPTKELLPEPDSSTASCTKEKKSKSRHRKKSKEKSRKKSRSLSVEIVYDGSSSEKTTRHHKKKKKHKKKSKRHKSKERTGKHSSTVITIDSDSDHPANDCSITQASSDNKDNRLNPADSTVLESMTGEMERPTLTVGVNTVTKQESSQAVGASGELLKQSCVPHVEGETVED